MNLIIKLYHCSCKLTRTIQLYTNSLRMTHLNHKDVYTRNVSITKYFHLLEQCPTYPEISQMINPPELKCPQLPFLHQPMAVRTTTATTAEVKKTRHRSWLLHLHQGTKFQLLLMSYKSLAMLKLRCTYALPVLDNKKVDVTTVKKW